MRARRMVAATLAGVLVLGAPVAPELLADDDVDAVDCVLPDNAYEVRSLESGDGDDGDELPSTAERVLRFVNLSDSHIIDDEVHPVMTGNVLESVLDPTIGNNSAQRLHEEYTDEVLNAMVATINACAERLGEDPGDALEFMVATGDLTDNAVLNEVRRYIDNLGGTSGHDTAFEANCGYVTHHSTEDAKAGFDDDGACPIPPEVLALPTGKLVADTEQREPQPESDTLDSFRPTASLRQIAETQAAAHQGGSAHVAPGLPEHLRCDSTEDDEDAGCGNERLAIPHYAAFGNHDGYPRGTVTFQQPFQAGSLAFGRYFLESQREFINEYFHTNAEPEGHGFNFVDEERWTDADDRNDGYYAFDASGGVRVVVLNTIADGVIEEVHGDGQVVEATGGHVTGNEATNPVGLEMGVMDPEQLAWLQDELDAAADRPVLVFSHHPDNSFSETRLGFTANGPSGVTAEELNEELGARGNVVAWIAGHTHRHRVRPCVSGGCDIGAGFSADPAHGFWRVETASLVDFPQEGRVVEVFRLPAGRQDGLPAAEQAQQRGQLPDPPGLQRRPDHAGPPAASEYALRLTTIRPDPGDPVAARSRELSIAEKDCSTAAMMGGPASSGPYDQERLETFAGNAAAGAESGNFCSGDVQNDPGGSQGTPLDRDVVLLP